MQTPVDCWNPRCVVVHMTTTRWRRNDCVFGVRVRVYSKRGHNSEVQFQKPTPAIIAYDVCSPCVQILLALNKTEGVCVSVFTCFKINYSQIIAHTHTCVQWLHYLGFGTKCTRWGSQSYPACMHSFAPQQRLLTVRTSPSVPPDLLPTCRSYPLDVLDPAQRLFLYYVFFCVRPIAQNDEGNRIEHLIQILI